MAEEKEEPKEEKAPPKPRRIPSISAPNPPNVNQDQANTFELLLVLGIVLLLVSPVGKWLGDIVKEITTKHDVNLSLNPFQQSTTTSTTTKGPNQPAGSSGPSGATRLFNVPIVGPTGEAGSIQVVAHDVQSAFQNAYQGGNVPTGPAVPA